ncbi:type IV pilus biogenesis/stability protein PilW [Thalassotalea mangrovi]|uniref:Type IV pilus biogenesis/stability protein PilW n=1 Tax=Thalassotalea mangrovi TaxID=2572245 RepID=A0A4U1B8R5_9GAMM|nr:type IV pilus biogenesis/stability protein PilW [Thalassotalea mangrovi]TKB47089.1 type IV pilus biogenesis/stability protein PilW [Thalassotalea mangrovi]
MHKSVKMFSAITLAVVTAMATSGCVTQNYAEEKPVVDRDVNKEQKAKTRISLALSYLNMGNMAQAKFNLERAKEFAPDLVDVYTAFAHYFEVVGETEQAEESYRKALDIEDDNADTLNNFGVFLCRQQRVSEAETLFKKAIRVPSYLRVAETYENIALCHLKVNDIDKAEHAMERSLAHSPNRATSLLQLAQFKYAKGDYDQAGLYMSRFELATRRFTPQAMALAFKIQQNMGNAEIAENYAKMLINMFPESEQAQSYLEDGLIRIAEDDLAERYHRYVLKTAALSTTGKQTARVKKSVVKSKQQSPQGDASAVVSAATKPVSLPATQDKGKPQNKPPVDNSSSSKTQTAATPVKQQTSPVQPPAINAAAFAVNKQTPKPAVTAVGNQAAASAINVDGPVHIVAKGDNLYRISLKYNITISTLRRWNDLVDENIHVGQVIRLSRPKK